jgi:hypothetical protein
MEVLQQRTTKAAGYRTRAAAAEPALEEAQLRRQLQSVDKELAAVQAKRAKILLQLEECERSAREQQQRQEEALREDCREAGRAVQTAIVSARGAAHRCRIEWNARSCPLLQLLAREDARTAMLRPELLGVVTLCRFRGICRNLRLWADQALALCPQVLGVGGSRLSPEHLDYFGRPEPRPSASICIMDWRTLQFVSCNRPHEPGLPRMAQELPVPRVQHTLGGFADGRLVVAGGHNSFGRRKIISRQGILQYQDSRGTAFEWRPACAGAVASLSHPSRVMPPPGMLPAGWVMLPPMSAPRDLGVAVRLLDDRLAIFGGSWRRGRPRRRRRQY